MQIRDPASGDKIREMQFVGKDWQVHAITSLDFNGNGREEIAVLATRDDGQAAGVQIRNAETKAQVSWVSLPMSAGSR